MARSRSRATVTTSAAATSRAPRTRPRSSSTRWRNSASAPARRRARSACSRCSGTNATITGASLNDLYRLGRLAQSVNPANIRNYTIPVGGGQCLPLLVGRVGRVRRLRRRRRARIALDPGVRSTTLDAARRASPSHADRLVYRETIPAQAGVVRRPEEAAPRRAAANGSRAAASSGCGRIRPRRSTRCAPATNVVLATGTASGKSLCYQLPIVEAVVDGRQDTALLVFPTKALAQDQLRSLRSWLVPGLKAVTYDGDTPTDDRAWVRRNANVVLTNPEMLHMGILPSHQRWATFLMRLRYVVIDELHTLRGIFGSHVAHLLRRLQRVCEHYGSHPTFCFAERDHRQPGRARGARCAARRSTFDRRRRRAAVGARRRAAGSGRCSTSTPGARASANVEAGATARRRSSATATRRSAFTRSRRGAELVAQYARRDLQHIARRCSRRASPPTGRATAPTSGACSKPISRAASSSGSSPPPRSSSASTSAASTPSCSTASPARSRRCGSRPGGPGAPAGGPPRCSWPATTSSTSGTWPIPTELTRRQPEPAVVNPDNPFVLHPQLACAAHELPLEPSRRALVRRRPRRRGARARARRPAASRAAGRCTGPGADRPAAGVGLRSGSGDRVPPRRRGDRARGRHRRRRARVHRRAPGRALPAPGPAVPGDPARPGEPRRLARVVRRATSTRSRASTPTSRSSRSTSSVAIGPGTVHLGAVEVTNHVHAYQRHADLDPAGHRGLRARPAAAHAHDPGVLVHGAARRAARRRARCPRRCSARCTPPSTGSSGCCRCSRSATAGTSAACRWPRTRRPASRRSSSTTATPAARASPSSGTPRPTRHLDATLELIAACPCDDGCPSCVQSPKCGNWNESLDKRGAITLLRLLADR